MPYFGFKAKLSVQGIKAFNIVLCLILDSRQNTACGYPSVLLIVLCLILDSRQNKTSLPSREACNCTVPYFGFKAKHGLRLPVRTADCTVPYFGFKAKLLCAVASYSLDCTVPYFGFKAKLESAKSHFPPYCTVPYFGFKAKPFICAGMTRIIVLCLILDSRQNRHNRLRPLAGIVLCLILDSRQNHLTVTQDILSIVLCLILDSRQNDQAKRFLAN